MKFPQQLFDKLVILLRWGERQGWGKGEIKKKNVLVSVKRGSCEPASQGTRGLSQKTVLI